MKSQKILVVVGMVFILLVVGACSFTNILTNTPTPEPPTIFPSATNTTIVITPALDPTESVLENSGPFYGSIKIIGTEQFIDQTKQALALLETKAPEAYRKVETYIGLIEQYEKSGMWAWEDPPRFAVGDATAFYSVTWYAASIAHDATHSELYHQYLKKYGGVVPDEVWTGEDVERFCIGYQIEVMKQIDGPQDEIDYLAGLDGTHCDLDGDGDCDAVDYENRDW
jgi:hypothetical protein